MALEGDRALIGYYTSPVNLDWPWLMGMVLRSDILISSIDLTELEKAALK